MSEVPLYHTPAVLGLVTFWADPPAAHHHVEKERGDLAFSPVSADGLICKHFKFINLVPISITTRLL